MPNIFCVRAGDGTYADHFYLGGYTGVTHGIIIRCRFQFYKSFSLQWK